ncbi:MAG: efflux RND transporter periplasmic adaptor subunit [Desulfosalsimonadaceae bacterium]
MKKSVRILIHAGLALAFIAAGAAGFKMLKSGRDALGRHQPSVPLPLVRTLPIDIGSIDLKITGEGTVEPVQQSQIAPQVDGRVTRISESLINGGSFAKGDLLVAIDPRDYEIAVTLSEANVKEAQSQYETALQESEAAINEWERIHPEEAPPPLVAKKPQLEAARANLEAQKANLKKARLDLERTRITAPFDGRVASEQVDTGQYVSPGQELAKIYATSAVEIAVPLENNELNWFDVPGFTTDDGQGSKAVVRARVAGRERTWQGSVVRAKGKINTETRMVSVVIRVPDPYSSKPPLSIGQFAEVEISGKTLSDAAVIPRAALHEKNRVWVVDPEQGRLYFRSVSVARMDKRGVVVKSGLKKGDQAVVSPLKGATDGMRVRHVTAVDREAS